MLDLLYNTQILGDFYNIWKFGIYNLINSETFLPNSIRISEFPAYLNSHINDIPLGDFNLSIIDEEPEDLINKILLRNQKFNENFHEETLNTKIKMEEFVKWNNLINEIIQKIRDYSVLEPININKIVLKISRNSRINKAK